MLAFSVYRAVRGFKIYIKGLTLYRGNPTATRVPVGIQSVWRSTVLKPTALPGICANICGIEILIAFGINPRRAGRTQVPRGGGPPISTKLFGSTFDLPATLMTRLSEISYFLPLQTDLIPLRSDTLDAKSSVCARILQAVTKRNLGHHDRGRSLSYSIGSSARALRPVYTCDDGADLNY